uniref:Serpentine receptor class gamma n=1 Tax=Caenorhabditis japonica TaxID=281687 RepID=A0A8R1DLK6_CAEJA
MVASMKTIFLYIYIIYGAPSILLYLFTLTVIAWKWKHCNTSFYQFYIFEFFMNIVTFINGYHSIRLPNIACYDCYFADYYRRHGKSSFANQVQYAMQFHMAYVQYLTTAVVAVNRTTLVYDSNRYEKQWRQYSSIIMFLIFMLPFLITYPVFLNDAYFQYDPTLDRFSLICSYKSSTLFRFLLPAIAMSTMVTFVANFISWRRICQIPVKTQKIEIQFVLVSAMAGGIQSFGTLITFLMLKATPGSALFEFTNMALPFVTDALTLSQPYLLLICCTLVGGFQ